MYVTCVYVCVCVYLFVFGEKLWMMYLRVREMACTGKIVRCAIYR